MQHGVTSTLHRLPQSFLQFFVFFLSIRQCFYFYFSIVEERLIDLRRALRLERLRGRQRLFADGVVTYCYAITRRSPFFISASARACRYGAPAMAYGRDARTASAVSHENFSYPSSWKNVKNTFASSLFRTPYYPRSLSLSYQSSRRRPKARYTPKLPARRRRSSSFITPPGISVVPTRCEEYNTWRCYIHQTATSNPNFLA